MCFVRIIVTLHVDVDARGRTVRKGEVPPHSATIHPKKKKKIVTLHRL